MRSVLAEFDQYVKLNMKIPPEILTSLAGYRRAGPVGGCDRRTPVTQDRDKQKILEMRHTRERLEHILGVMESEIDLLQVEKRIRGRVKRQMEKSSASTT